ncbi:exportin-1, putative [Plasmodium ovale]|uniref:Exportin-T n=1 Tax=Plasmodium ovale TaxID=36330 RepID=A0A1C3L4Q6_PLAOA|nr:exportin-1, putative [Plasmodium ovale]
MDQLEVAILSLYGSDCSRISKGDAQKFCEDFQRNEDSWKYCIGKLLESDKLEIKFFCIHVIIDKLSMLKVEDLLLIKSSIYTYIEKKYITANDDTCVVNKIIQLYLNLLEYLYPVNMNDGFKFLINLIMVNNDINIKCMYINFFLKMMNMLDIEYIDNAYSKKNIQMITNMKEGIKNNDLPIIIECFYLIMNLNMENESSLCILTLSKYVSWIDINYVVNDKILTFIYQALNSSTSITESCYSFLTALLRKGMNPVNKIQFIENINIIYVVQNCNKIVDLSFHLNKNILLKRGELINYICLELVESIHEIVKSKDYHMDILKYNQCCEKGTNLLFQILPHALDIYAINDFYIASTIERFFSLFFTKFKSIIDSTSVNTTTTSSDKDSNTTSNSITSYKIPASKLNIFISNLMCTTVNKFEFPSYIGEDYDEEDEDFITFYNFRENIEKLFQRLILFDKLKAIEIAKNSIIYLNEQFDNLQWNQIESKLYAFYLTTSIYSEYKGNNTGSTAASAANTNSVSGTKENLSRGNSMTSSAETFKQPKDVSEMVTVDYNNLLYECLMELLKNRKIVNCTNHLININLMEIFQRLNLFFVKHPQYVEYSLHVFITNGVRSNKNKVVKKAVHIFKKFLKANSIVISSYLKDILHMLEQYLDIPCVYQKIGTTSNNSGINLNSMTIDQDTIKSVYSYIYAEKNYTHEDQIDIYETAGLLLLHYDFVKAKRASRSEDRNAQQSSPGTTVSSALGLYGTACTDLNTRNEKINEQLIPNYKDRIFYFQGILKKLLENLASIKNIYLSSSKTQHDSLCLSFTCSVVIKCIGALCKNVNINMTDALINDLDNTLGIIISESLELFYNNYIVRDSVLFTYRILSNLFKELSLNYTIKILPYFYNISYNMIMDKLRKGNTTARAGNCTEGQGSNPFGFNMTTPTSLQILSNASTNDVAKYTSLSQEELKYLYNELNELSILVCYLISTYKEKSFDTFVKPYIQNITQIHLNVWKCTNVQSLEMQREQNSVLSPLLLILYNISLNIPSAMHNFISIEHIALNHKQFCELFSSDEIMKSKTSEAITSILLISLNYKNTNDLNICLYALQTISNMLNSAACMATANEILSKYPLMQIIDILCLSLKSLDYSDPKNKRVIQEVLSIFRLFCGFKVNTNSLPNKIIENSQICLQNSLLSVFKNNQNDIGVLLQAINANNQQQFRQILSNFVA